MATRSSNRNNSRKSGGSGRKRSKVVKRLMIAEAVLVISLLAVYLYFSIYYQKHFFSNTTVNGVDTSNMTVERAEQAINAEVKTYSLALEERNGVEDTIYGDSIDLHTVFEGGLEQLIHQQNGYEWPLALMKSRALEIGTMLEYDESLLQGYVEILHCFDEENVIEPTDASISGYEEGGYKIVPENPGAKVNKEILYKAIQEAILSLQPTLSIEEAGAYEKPAKGSDYPAMNTALQELNKYAGTKITYEFGDVTEVLDGSKISEWLTVDENYQVRFNEEGIKEYVDYIGKNYNSFGRTRTFKTTYGDVLEIKGGDYGWWLDRATEVRELTDLINNGEQLVKKPAYFQTAQKYGEDDIGNTYVEVNLSAQHLFFYKDGEMILESDFVSGNLSKGYGTPVGTYPVQYKENDAVLVGEDYETPVKYWMPFNRNIGFHDADWRSKFGKDYYLYNGSHGCINMPPANAKKMFENIKRGVAVVVYELPGTENFDVTKVKIPTPPPSPTPTPTPKPTKKPVNKAAE